MGKKLGGDAKLYWDATPLANGAAGGDWTELKCVRDVRLPMDATEADLTSRGNAGWRSTDVGLLDAGVDIECLWDGADTGIEAIRDAYLNRAAIALVILDGDIEVNGSQGLAANWKITGFARGEPLEEGITLTITAKPYDHHQWYEVGGSS